MLRYKQYISLFFLAIFISLKLAGLHEFTHSDDELTDDCKICEFVVVSDATLYIASNNPTFKPLITQTVYKQVIITYTIKYVKNYLNNCLCGRPPPLF